MATGYKLGFSSNVFHLDVKYHMAWDLLIPNRRNMTIRKDLEGNAKILHFLCNSISPECVAILAVRGKVFSLVVNVCIIGSFQSAMHNMSKRSASYPRLLPR